MLHGGRGRVNLQWRVQEQSPWLWVEAPLKLKHFWFLDVQWKPQISPLFQNLETQRNQIFV